MKVMLIGEGDPLSSSYSCDRIFREFGCETLHWDNKKPSLLFGNRNWWRMSRPERSAYDVLASSRFLTDCKRFRPDVVFTQKGENIHSYAIRRALEETGSRFVLWYGDNPFRAEVTTFNVIRNLRRCDIFYSYGKFMIETLRSAGCRRVEYLPFAFDPVVHPPDTAIADSERAHFQSEICFVGTWDAQREAALALLTGFDLAIWGQFWKERIGPETALGRCIRGGTTWGDQMVKCFKGTRVVLNFLRDFNHTSHNFRTMEATGSSGGALLTKRTVEQAEQLFTEGEHLFCYGDIPEMPELLSDMLANSCRLEAASSAARKHVFENHLLKYRIQQVLTDLGYFR